ncbi:MAG: DNA gyrase inhibitor YacG [Alphaproteobacteria bacterium]
MACPLCQKPTDKAFKPFCSRRCADLDLGNWLGDKYRVAGEPVNPDVIDLDSARAARDMRDGEG